MSHVVGTYGPLSHRRASIAPWLLYAYSLVYPFFVFSIIVPRDTASVWVTGLMGMFLLLELCRTGGRFWVDRSMLFLMALVLLYLYATALVHLQEPAVRWGGRSPMERAIGVDIRIITAAFSFIVFANMLTRLSSAEFVMVFRIQMIVGGVIAIFGLVQYFLFTVLDSSALVGIESTNPSFKLRSNFLLSEGERVFRASSVFSEPSYFGFVLVPLFVKSFIAWRTRIEWASPSIQLLFLAMFAVAILVNLSFTAIVSLMVVGLLALLSAGRSVRMAAGLLGVLLLAGVFVLASPLADIVVSRLQAIVEAKDLSTIDRLVRAYSGLIVFLESPWLGVGPGGFAFLYPQMGLFVERGHMHSPLNMWLTVLTDVGVFGFLCFVAFLVQVFVKGMRRVKAEPLVRVYLWSTIAYLVLLTSVDLWYLDMFWFELAALLCLSTVDFHHENEGVHDPRLVAVG